MVSFCSFQISFPNTCTVLIFSIAGLLFLCLEHVEHWERIASRWRPAFSSHLIKHLSETDPPPGNRSFSLAIVKPSPQPPVVRAAARFVLRRGSAHSKGNPSAPPRNLY